MRKVDKIGIYLIKYAVQDPDKPKHLVIDEESAAIVRRIFRMSVDGHGVLFGL